jgi:hypothetical protein
LPQLLLRILLAFFAKNNFFPLESMVFTVYAGIFFSDSCFAYSTAKAAVPNGCSAGFAHFGGTIASGATAVASAIAAAAAHRPGHYFGRFNGDHL